VRPELLQQDQFESRLGSHAGEPSWARRFARQSRALFFAVDRARALEATFAPPDSRFFRCFHAVVTGEDETIQDLWQDEARAICDMRDESAKIGARFAVVLWPLEGQVLTDLPACKFQRNAQRICDAARVPMISMLEPLKSCVRDGEAPYLPFEQHPTPEGYRRCSEKIAAAIESEGLLRR
jgi:hypothetical protein